MLYDIAHFGVALLAAVVLGVIVGWYTHSDRPRHGPILRLGHGWIFWSAALFFVGLVLALTHAIPDRTGLWLETALLVFVAYLAGCPLFGLLFAANVRQDSARMDRSNPSGWQPRSFADFGPRSSAGSISDAAERLGDSRSPPTPVVPSVTPSVGVMPAAAHAAPGRASGTTGIGSPAGKGSHPLTKTSDATLPTGGIISDDPGSVDKPKR